MTILVIPWFGCNLRCAYCFSRTLTHTPQKLNIDLEAMENALRMVVKQRPGDSISLHGGEATALPRDLFKKLLDMIYRVAGRVAIQTNGFAIDDEMIQLFKKYKVNVGLSIDGPPELNTLRGFPDDPEKQKIYLKRVYENLEKLVENKIWVSIIVVLHKVNAGTKEAREKLAKWIIELYDKYGVKYGRLNPLFDPFESPQIKQYELEPKQLGEAYIDIWKTLREYPDLVWSPYRDIIDQLLGLSVSLCSFGKCDVYSSVSAIAIYPDGTLGTCDRTYGLSIVRRIDPPLDIRYKILKETECKNCKYWNICHGGCPMEAPYGDWRHKTKFCEGYKMLYELLEKEIRRLLPNIILSIDIDDWYDNWRGSFNPFSYILEKRSTWRDMGRKIQHIKKTYAAPKLQQPTPREIWADKVEGHGDRPHGDWSNHGDSFRPRPATIHSDAGHGDAVLHKDRGHGDWGNHGDKGHGDWGDHADG